MWGVSTPVLGTVCGILLIMTYRISVAASAAPEMMGTEQQLECLIDFLHFQGWLTLQVLVPTSVSSSSVADFLRRLARAGIFTNLRRGSPADDPPEDLDATMSPHVWFTPDSFANSSLERSTFERVRSDLHHQWLLVSLSGVRKAHFLGGYAPLHQYMVKESDAVRVYSGLDYHQHQVPSHNGLCRGLTYQKIIGRATSGANKHQPMHGITIRIVYPLKRSGAIATLPTKLTIDRDRITGGMYGSVILHLQQILGFNYTLRGVGSKNGSAWDACSLQMNANKADLFAGWMAQTQRRRPLLEFTVAFGREKSGIVIPANSNSTWQPFNISDRFSKGAWLTLLGLQLIALLVLGVIARAQAHFEDSGLRSREISVSSWALTVFGILCGQGAVVSHDQAISYRIAMFCLYMMGLFVCTAYSGDLLSSITVRQHHLPFQSLSEALRKGWRMQNYRSSATRDIIVPALFGRKMHELPRTSVGPPRSGELQIGTPDVVHNKNLHPPSPDHPPVCIWPGGVLTFPALLAVRPNFPYKSAINRALAQLREAGVIQHEETRWKPDERHITCRAGMVVESTEISILSVKQLFVLLAVGGGGALFLLGAEFAAAKLSGILSSNI